MSHCSSSSMQMPTPPMTQAEYEWERHQQCSEWQCLLSDEVHPFGAGDWTLFPSEMASLADRTPRPVPMNENAGTPKPPQGRAQRDSKAMQEQRRNGTEKERKTKSHTARATKQPSTWSVTERNAASLTSTSVKDDCSDVLICPIAGFADTPRTSESAPISGRFPTPPLEDMSEMFAPIEALGEDLRWYRSIRSSHIRCGQPSRD